MLVDGREDAVAASPPIVDTLTPSELAYFHAGAFAREKKLVDAVKVVHAETRYDGSELGGALLATALLAAEEAGAVALEPGTASRLFGLRKVEVLTVKPGPANAAFPPGTLEAAVRPAVDAAKSPPDAQRVFEALLREDAPDPYVWSVALVERGLAERQLLKAEEVRRLKVFRSQVYTLPEATAALVRGTTPEHPRRLLDRAQRERPDAWRLLQDGLKRAVASRTERDTSDIPD